MRMSKNDYNTLKSFIEKTVNGFDVDIESKYDEAGLSKKRFRWDMLYMSKIKIGDGIGIINGDIIDPNLNDDHIDTALRKIFTHKR